MRLVTLSIVVLATAAAGCQKSETAPPPKEVGNLRGCAAGCNLLLITMDTTRADRIGCYGRARAATPALDALAAAGVRFEQAYTPVPITLPSHASLLTGTLPPEHGVRDNGRFVLGAARPTLAELYRARGYRTAAFIASAVLDARYGLSRGFETYDDQIERTGAARAEPTRRADVVCDRALAWLDGVRAERFACWVHFFDPHAPYDPPPQWLARTADPYDGEIAFMDSQIGRLLDWLAAHDLRRRTLVVAVADHGESLGDHNYDWHALLVYDGTMRVPLVFALPGGIPTGRVCAELASTADVLPTIVELMGWEPPAGVSGQSLVRAVSGDPLPARALYGETEFPYYNFGWSGLRCLIEPGWKYIQAPRAELYDRRSDPSERTNLADARPDVVRRMGAQLAELESALVPCGDGAQPLDHETLTELRSLGYAAGAPPQPSGPALRDPKDMLGVKRSYRIAESLVGGGNAEQAIALLEPAAAASPESFVIVDLLGKAYALAGRTAEGERALRRALALWPESAETWAVLAQLLAVAGRAAEAEAAAHKAAQFDPRFAAVQHLLGQLATQAGRVDDAIAAYRRVVELEPTAGAGYAALAQLYQARGAPGEAVAILRRGLAQAPAQPGLANDLAWLLATCPHAEWRDGAEAVRLAERAVTLSSRPDANLLDTLAAAYAEAGRFDDALAALDRALAVARAAGAAEAALAELQTRRALYERRQPYRSPTAPADAR